MPGGQTNFPKKPAPGSIGGTRQQQGQQRQTGAGAAAPSPATAVGNMASHISETDIQLALQQNLNMSAEAIRNMDINHLNQLRQIYLMGFSEAQAQQPSALDQSGRAGLGQTQHNVMIPRQVAGLNQPNPNLASQPVLSTQPTPRPPVFSPSQQAAGMNQHNPMPFPPPVFHMSQQAAGLSQLSSMMMPQTVGRNAPNPILTPDQAALALAQQAAIQDQSRWIPASTSIEPSRAEQLTGSPSKGTTSTVEKRKGTVTTKKRSASSQEKPAIGLKKNRTQSSRGPVSLHGPVPMAPKLPTPEQVEQFRSKHGVRPKKQKTTSSTSSSSQVHAQSASVKTADTLKTENTDSKRSSHSASQAAVNIPTTTQGTPFKSQAETQTTVEREDTSNQFQAITSAMTEDFIKELFNDRNQALQQQETSTLPARLEALSEIHSPEANILAAFEQFIAPQTTHTDAQAASSHTGMSHALSESEIHDQRPEVDLGSHSSIAHSSSPTLEFDLPIAMPPSPQNTNQVPNTQGETSRRTVKLSDINPTFWPPSPKND